MWTIVNGVVAVLFPVFVVGVIAWAVGLGRRVRRLEEKVYGSDWRPKNNL